MNGLYLQFTGSNLSDISEFLGSTLFEFNGRDFVIHGLRGTLLLEPLDTLVKKVDGTFDIEKAKRGKKK